MLSEGDKPKEEVEVVDNVVIEERPSFVVMGWMMVNLVSTVSIVFTNKYIFADKNFRDMPLSFAAFHFICTSITLFVMSSIGKFTPKFIGIWEILPLCLAFCGNVLLPNLSLAYSPVAFYQIVRILVTPATALLNNVLYNVMISKKQLLAIIPICFGIGLAAIAGMSGQGEDKSFTLLGFIFGVSGVLVSSIYIIWIGTYFKQYSVSSLQLLYNQAPLSVVILLICIPFNDVLPPLDELTVDSISMIILSGMFAILINVSQFYIVQGTSALTSTIVGHLKTCSIVSLGWILGGKMSNLSLGGVIIAVFGIIQYSIVSYKKR